MEEVMILNICDNGDVLSVMRIVNITVLIIKIAIPIILILSLSINYLKAVYTSDNDALVKANKQAVNKMIAAILIFFIPTFVNVLVKLGSSENGYSNCNIDDPELGFRWWVSGESFDKFYANEVLQQKIDFDNELNR